MVQFAYEIHLDGNFIKSKVNLGATSFTNLTVWLSNPWHDTFDGVLEEVNLDLEMDVFMIISFSLTTTHTALTGPHTLVRQASQVTRV